MEGLKMIIDEVLDAKYNNYTIDLDYIKEEAQMFKMQNIIDAIEAKDEDRVKQALNDYIILNNYNPEIKKEIKKIKVTF